MKNTITLNIGLASNSGPCQPHLILADLVHHGFRVHASRVVQGVWDGQPEACLVVQASYVLPLAFNESRLCIGHALVEIARTHKQDCIAVEWEAGSGDLFPVQAFSFDPKKFHRIEPQAELSAFINYLDGTLIPDLKAAGNEATAEDFETCLRYLTDSEVISCGW